MLQTTFSINSPTCAGTDKLQWNGSAFVCAADNVDDADASATNELQDIFATIDAPNGTDPAVDSQTDVLQFLDGSGITITGDSVADSLTIAATLGDSIETGEITDGSLLFADLNQNGCSGGQIIEWGGAGWICGTDDAGGGGFTFDITDGATSQTITNANIVTFADGTGVDVIVSATDTVTFSAVLGTSISSAEIELNTIVADDVATGAITTDEILDGTILLSDLGQNGCSDTQVLKWDNGSTAWICASDIDTDTDTNLDETAVDAFVSNNGYLTSEIDGSITNEIQDLGLAGSILSLSSDPSTVDLSAFLDNTDTQDLSLSSNTLSLVDGGSVDLAPYLDNTDTQDLSLSSNTLSLTNGGSVDLAPYLDNTGRSTCLVLFARRDC